MRASYLILTAVLAGMAGMGVPTAKAAGMASEAVTYPSVPVSALAPKLAREVRQGEYLVKLADCATCHTIHGDGKSGEAFAGGYAMKTPFGTIFAPNITPDKQTGIGSWTFHQFDQAVRFGVSPHGYLFAAMPYNYYDIMSRAQVHAIWEYLQRVPAVHKENKPLEMQAPFGWRWIQFGWRFAFFQPNNHRFRPDPEHSALWNRGKFMVDGPAHCGGCHTPHNMMGGSQRRSMMQGSDISGAWAPNITAYAMAPHPASTVVSVFKEGRGLSGGTLQGPMVEVDANSLRYLRPRDIRAVAVYLDSVKSEVPSGPRPVADAEVDLSLGKTTYQRHCAACHDSGVGGTPKVGDVAAWAPLEKTPMFILYENVWHGVSIMPPRGGCQGCSRRELTSAVSYMLEESKPGARSSQGAAAVNATAGTTSADTVSLAAGKDVYEAHCAACHARGLAGAPKYGDSAQWGQRLDGGLKALRENTLKGIGAMPPKGGCSGCTTAQITSAVDYMVAGSGGKQLVQKSLGTHD